MERDLEAAAGLFGARSPDFGSADVVSYEIWLGDETRCLNSWLANKTNTQMVRPALWGDD